LGSLSTSTFKKDPINIPNKNIKINPISTRITQKEELFYGQVVAAAAGAVVVLYTALVESQQ
jgi:hypothetical protein